MLIIFWYDIRVINITTSTMQNTFQINSIDDRKVILTWASDMLITKAIAHKKELQERYPHLQFEVMVDKQYSFSI